MAVLPTDYADGVSGRPNAADVNGWTTQINANTSKLATLAAVYTHTQSTAAATWTITHPLGRKPGSVSVWIADVLVEADVETPNTTTVVVTFASPQSGRAQLT